MKVLGLITARGGSKGIPGKNIKLLAGKPLISYVIKDGLKSGRIHDLVVSTDDHDIAEISAKYGANVPFIRPDELARDSTPSIDVIIHALQYFDGQGLEYDAVCLLQPTSPFKPEGFIDKCIEAYIRSEADCLVSVLEVPHQFNPHWTFQPKEQGLLRIATGEDELIPRRQELPKAYYRDGSVYLIGRKNIMDHHKIVHGNIAYEVSDPEFYCNLDTLKDWNEASVHPKLKSSGH